MYRIKDLIDRFKEFRKKHFALFLIGEELILFTIIVLMAFVTKISDVENMGKESEKLLNSHFVFSYVDVTNFIWLLPSLFSIICIVYSLFVLLIGIKKDEQVMLKITKPLSIIGILFFFADTLILTMYQTQYYVDGTSTYQYNHKLGLMITLIVFTLQYADIFSLRMKYEPANKEEQK